MMTPSLTTVKQQSPTLAILRTSFSPRLRSRARRAVDDPCIPCRFDCKPSKNRRQPLGSKLSSLEEERRTEEKRCERTSIPAFSKHLSNPLCMISTGLISRRMTSSTASRKLTESKEVESARRLSGSSSEMVDMRRAENRPENEENTCSRAKGTISTEERRREKEGKKGGETNLHRLQAVV